MLIDVENLRFSSFYYVFYSIAVSSLGVPLYTSRSYSFLALSIKMLGAMHLATLHVACQGAIFSRSLTSELVDLLRLIIIRRFLLQSKRAPYVFVAGARTRF